MASSLTLYKPELNPDVYFENNSPTFWNFGTGWTFGTNNVNGLGAEKINTALSNLQLLVLEGGLYTFQVLKPFKTYKWKFRVAYNTGGVCTFQIGGVTVQTIGAVPLASPVIYEGTVTTGSTGTVLFQSSAVNTVLLSYLNLTESPTDYVIDLNENIDVPLNMAIAEIQDPAKRDATFSRTITLPGTKNNNIFFDHIFEISGSGTHDPNKKVRAILVNDGIQQFDGYCRLDHINRIGNGLNNYSAISYEVTLFGDLGELMAEIGDKLISELDFSEYNHIYSRANQRSSWYAGIIRSGIAYSNTLDGAYLTISSCQYSAGRVQMNFSAAHSLAVNDWILIPQDSIVTPTVYKNFYLGEHMVYSIVSATSIVLQCPYSAACGNTFATNAAGTNRVRKHTKIGKGYVYPMTDADQNNGNGQNATQFYPGIYVKDIIDKIFALANRTYTSTHFNSFLFKKRIVNYSSGAMKLTNAVIEARLFQAGSSTDQLSTFVLAPNFGPYQAHSPTSTPSPIDVALDNDSTNGNFDNGGQFNTVTYRYVPNASGVYTLSGAFIAAWYWTQPGGVNQSNLGNFQIGVLQIEVYNYTTNAVVANCLAQHSIDPMPDNTQQFATFEFTFSADNLQLTVANSYGVRVRVVTAPNIQFNVGGVPYTGNITVNFGILGAPPTTDFFRNEIKNTNLQLGDTINMNSILPKMKCSEFLNNIIKMGNLYIEKDSTNSMKYLIESRDDYYALGTEEDWTDKLDVSQSLIIEPLGLKNKKIYNYNYAEDGDFYNKDHRDKYGSVYGNKRYQVDKDFANEEYTTAVTFASTVLTDLFGCIVSNIQGATDTNAQQDPFASKLRILIFNCASNPNGSWYHTVNISDLSEAISANCASQIYPYAGHLDKPDAPYYDLNWWYPSGVYFPYDSWTDRNLFNLFYKKSVAEVTDKDAKLITCYLHLTAYDIFKLNFKNIFIIDGHSLRLNKITDFLVNKNAPTKCEFIKANDRPPFVSSTGLLNGFGGITENEGFENGFPFFGGQGNSGTQGSNNRVFIQGDSRVGRYSYNVMVNGDGNNIGNSVSNVVVTGYNNVVYPGLTDVYLINTNGVTVTESGQSYLNGQNVTNIQAKILRLST